MKIKFQGTVREFLNLAEECFNLDGTMSAKIDSPPPGSSPPPEALYIVGLTDDGRSMVINAIKEFRELTHLGLTEAKGFVEAWRHNETSGIKNEHYRLGPFSGNMPKTQFLEVKAI